MRVFALVDSRNGAIISQICEEFGLDYIVASSISAPELIPENAVLFVDTGFAEKLKDVHISDLKSRGYPVILIGEKAETGYFGSVFDEISGSEKEEIIALIKKWKNRIVKDAFTGTIPPHSTLSLGFSENTGVVIIDDKKRILGCSKNLERFREKLEMYFRKIDFQHPDHQISSLKFSSGESDHIFLYSIAQAHRAYVVFLMDATEFAKEMDLLKLKNLIFESAINIAELPFVVHRGGEIILWNRSAERLLGKEIQKKNFFDFFEPKNRSSVIRGTMSLQYSGRDTFEMDAVIHIGRKKMEISLSTAVLEYEGGWIHVSVFKDVTEKRKIMRLLKILFRIYEHISTFRNRKFILQTSVSELEKQYEEVFAVIKSDGDFEIITGREITVVEDAEYGCLNELFSKQTEIRVEKQKEFVRCLKKNDGIEYETLICPMKTGRRVIGYIVILSREKFMEGEIRILEAISLMISHIYYKHELEEIEHMALKQLENNIKEFSKIIDRIKNPLAVISGYCEIHEDVESPEVIFSRIREETKRMTHLLENVEKNWEISEEILKRIEKILENRSEDRN